jgi:hypothetical protein
MASVSKQDNKVSLFVATPEQVASDTRIQLKIRFADCGKNFVLPCRVGALESERADRPAGLEVVVETAHDLRSYEQLLRFCNGRQEASRRVKRSWPCQLQRGPDTRPAKILDLSLTGAFIFARKLTEVRPGCTVKVLLGQGLFGLFKKEIEARVVWSGQKEGKPGVGVCFLAPSKKIVELMRQVQ